MCRGNAFKNRERKTQFCFCVINSHNEFFFLTIVFVMCTFLQNTNISLRRDLQKVALRPVSRPRLITSTTTPYSFSNEIFKNEWRHSYSQGRVFICEEQPQEPLTFQHFHSNSERLVGLLLVDADGLGHHHLTETALAQRFPQSQPGTKARQCQCWDLCCKQCVGFFIFLFE